MGTRSVQRFCRLLAVIGLGLAVLAPVAAWAQATGGGYPTPNTTPTTVSCGSPGSPQVCGTSVTAKAASTSSSGALAFTGGNIALLVGLGLVASVGGVVLVRVGRRANATR
jgi:hypothetical protein